MEVVGRRFQDSEIFLPQVIAAAQVVTSAMVRLRPLMLKSDAPRRGTVLLATVKGDIHDIGKNLVGTVIESWGFDVVDLGKNIGAEAILDAIAREKPDAVGLSALMTTTMPAMETTVALIKKRYPNLPVLIGGAAITTEFAERIGAIYTADAVAAAKKLNEIVADKTV